MIKESKPAIATADAELIRKVITFYLNKNGTALDDQEREQLLKLFHRLGRLYETG
tara:strand:- start:297 stop:461 length:165 start_codon:yes stop_codon:yes gene_type:complete